MNKIQQELEYSDRKKSSHLIEKELLTVDAHYIDNVLDNLLEQYNPANKNYYLMNQIIPLEKNSILFKTRQDKTRQDKLEVEVGEVRHFRNYSSLQPQIDYMNSALDANRYKVSPNFLRNNYENPLL